MMIKSLKLRDFISHADTKLEFPVGVTVLIGPNGAGKTSIVDGIVFALFGEKVRGEGVSDLIRSGCSSAEVELSFEEGGKEYTIRRTRKRTTSDALLLKNGEAIATGKSVTEEVLKLLKLDKETAINSLFVRQGEVARLVDAEPRERKLIMGKLIGLERLERAWQNMHSVLDHFKDKCKDYNVVKREFELKSKDSEEIEAKLKKIEVEVGKKKEELEIARKDLEKVKEDLETWENKRRRYSELTQDLSKLEERLREVSSNLESLKVELEEAEKAKEEVRKIEPEIAKIEVLEKLISLTSKRGEIENKTNYIQEELRRVSSLLSDLEKTKAAYEKYLVLSDEQIRLRKEYEKLREVEKEFTTVKTEVEFLKEEIDETKSEISDLESRALELLPEATLEAKESRLKELESKLSEIEEKTSILKEEQGQIQGRISEIKEYLSILGEAEVCPVCRSQLTPQHREEVKRDFEREMELLGQKLVEKVEEAKRLDKEKSELDRLLKKIGNLNVERLEKLRGELKNLEEGLKTSLAKLGELEKEVSKISELGEKLKDVERELKELKEDYERHVAAKRALERERSVGEIERDQKDLNTELAKLEGEISELFSRLGYEPENAEDELKNLRKLEKHFEVLKSKATRVEELRKKFLEKEEEVKSVETEIKDKKREISALGYSEEGYREAQERYREASEKVRELETELREIEKQRSEKLSELSELKKDIESLKVRLAELEKVNEFVKKLDRIRQAFSRDGVQKLLRERLAPLISELAGNYIESFNLDITGIIVNEDFEISIMKQGGEVSIKSISGGEKVAVAIALRLAIAKVLSESISTIIMDEPTTHLDEERRRDLVDIMRNFLRECSTIPQMIIVTHHRELEDVADTVYRVEKVGGISTVKLDSP